MAQAQRDALNTEYQEWYRRNNFQNDAEAARHADFGGFEQRLIATYADDDPATRAREIGYHQGRATNGDGAMSESATRVANAIAPVTNANLSTTQSTGGNPGGAGGSSTPLAPPPTLRAARTPTAPAALYPEQDASITPRLKGLLDSGSPLMQQAETAGLQQANKRGLLNSSMAVGAAQDSAYRVAVPIASQEAGQIHQRNLSGQQYQQEGNLQSGRLDSGERIAEMGEAGSLQRTQIGEAGATQRLNISEAGAFNRQVSDQNAAMARLREQGADQRTLQTMADAAALEREGKRLDAEQTRALAQLNESVRQFNATQGQSGRTAVADLATRAQDSYQRSVDAIVGNKDLSEANRATALTSAAAVRDSTIKLIEQLYDVDLQWDSPATQAAA